MLSVVYIISCRVLVGKTFSKPAKLVVTEKPNSYGRYWTWVHWELEVRTMDFLLCEEVLCRAWDWSQNSQPPNITWTLLGQGNNSMFRVKAHKETDEKVCRFKHAQLAGVPGWQMHWHAPVPCPPSRALNSTICLQWSSTVHAGVHDMCGSVVEGSCTAGPHLRALPAASAHAARPARPRGLPRRSFRGRQSRRARRRARRATSIVQGRA